MALQAQVNDFAGVGLQKTLGDGSFSHAGTTFTLDIGTLTSGAPGKQATLSVLNTASGVADLLRGSFATDSVANPFSLIGFAAFDNLAAGASMGGLHVFFAASLNGNFESSIMLHSAGFNTRGFEGALADQTLVLRGSVLAAVPEPGIYLMMFCGLMLIMVIGRRRASATY